MRTFASILVMLNVFISPVAIAADAFPYWAYVFEDDTPVRSGPGVAHYVTGHLPASAEVQVYRRDTGGWLAIRPPENSFSWVPARKVWRTDEPNVVEVVSDDACSWLGSVVEQVREHKWQVRLQRGELLAVLGEREMRDETTGASERWYKVAPPAGEFRWIHDRFVSREKSEWADDRDRPPGSLTDESSAVQSQIRPAAYFADDRPTSSSSSRSAPISVNSANLGSDGGSVRRASRLATTGTRGEPDDVRQLDAVALTNHEIRDTAPRGNDVLAEIEIDLSRTVARDASAWNLAPLRERTQQLTERGATPLERGRARLMLEKIGQFEALHKRHIEAERPVTVTPDAARSSPSSTRSVADPETAVEPRFDGVGTLLPVHSTKRVAPPFALMGDDGKVLHYVAPAPGLNLHRFAHKRIGVYGQRAATNSLNAPVLTAQRIVELDQHQN